MLKLCNSIKTYVWHLRSLEKLAIKMWFPFNFAKNLKDRHFVVGGSKNLKLSTNTCFGVSFQKNVFLSFLPFSSVCYQDDLTNSERNVIASSTARSFNNSWHLYVNFSKTINLCRNVWLIENWKFQQFILLNLVPMHNLLNANNCWHKQNLENCPMWPDICFQCTFRISCWFYLIFVSLGCRKCC